MNELIDFNRRKPLRYSDLDAAGLFPGSSAFAASNYPKWRP